MTASDPRTCIGYIRMTEFIDLLETYGPMTLEDVLSETGWTEAQFKQSRGSLSGSLALEDRDKVIPRPVAANGYAYTLVDSYRSGTSEDAEPSLQMAFGDVLTRQTTIYLDVQRMVDMLPAKSPERKLLNKTVKAMNYTLERMEECIVPLNLGNITAKAQYVLDSL